MLATKVTLLVDRIGSTKQIQTYSIGLLFSCSETASPYTKNNRSSQNVANRFRISSSDSFPCSAKSSTS